MLMKKLLAFAGFAGLLAGCSAPDYGRGGAAYEGSPYYNAHDPSYFHGGETNITRNAPVSPDVAPLVETNTPSTTTTIPVPQAEPTPVPVPEPTPELTPTPAPEPGAEALPEPEIEPLAVPEPEPLPEPEPVPAPEPDSAP